jgi:hypothetical protein
MEFSNLYYGLQKCLDSSPAANRNAYESMMISKSLEKLQKSSNSVFAAFCTLKRLDHEIELKLFTKMDSSRYE